VATAASQGIGLISAPEAETLLVDAGMSSSDAALVADEYAGAQVGALKVSLLAVAMIALAAFVAARRIPDRTVEPEAEPAPEGVAALAEA
jgi:hypothetical protein